MCIHRTWLVIRMRYVVTWVHFDWILYRWSRFSNTRQLGAFGHDGKGIRQTTWTNGTESKVNIVRWEGGYWARITIDIKPTYVALMQQNTLKTIDYDITLPTMHHDETWLTISSHYVVSSIQEQELPCNFWTCWNKCSCMIQANVSQLVKHFAIHSFKLTLTSTVVKFKRISSSRSLVLHHHHHHNNTTITMTPPSCGNQEPMLMLSVIPSLCFLYPLSRIQFYVTLFSKHIPSFAFTSYYLSPITIH